MPNLTNLLKYLVGTERNTGQANVNFNYPTRGNPSKLHLLTTNIRKKIEIAVENYVTKCSESHPNKLMILTSAKKRFDEVAPPMAAGPVVAEGGGGSLHKSSRKSRRKSRKSRKSTRRH
jgi:hypothetical protein